MMTLPEWAIKHGVGSLALHQLRTQVYGLDPGPASPEMSGKSEAAVQAQVRIVASKMGNRVWRNNVGALVDERGVPIRYGLANESKRQNEVLKSSDLIGIEHGTGRFLSYEIKAPGWSYSGTPREQAQLNWIGLINSLGGVAKFVTDPNQL